jgi:cyclase
MLKVRIIPTLLYKDSTLVKGISFDSWRRVGSLMQAVKVYNIRDVDELVFFDITASRESRPPDFELVDDFADECFYPLTVGGGIRNIDDVRGLLNVGADKVSLNTQALSNPDLIREASNNFGKQCIVVALDVKRNGAGEYELFSHSGTQATGRCPFKFAKMAEGLGAGEILVTSIDRDGTMKGYDIELIRRMSEAVTIPVIASGGAGSYDDMNEAITRGKANAVAAASLFHFTEQTPLEAKIFLKKKGIQTRA